jgi:hypothetical protein
MQAEAEPRFLSWFLQLGTACTLCLPAGGATGATGDCSDCTTSHQVPPSARQSQSQARAQSGRLRLHRGDVAQWKLVLDTLGTVVDELAALEVRESISELCDMSGTCVTYSSGVLSVDSVVL